MFTITWKTEAGREVAFVDGTEVGQVYKGHNTEWHAHARINGRHLTTIARTHKGAREEAESLIAELLAA